MVSMPISGKYTFRDFDYLADENGFGIPSDVKIGSIYIGTIESNKDGYVIKQVDAPKGHRRVDDTPKNKFKSKNLAAESLHKLWQWIRTENV